MASIVSSRVFDLPVRRSARWMFNCYALEVDDGAAVLIDPGLPSTATAALDGLASDGRDHGAVTALIVTHGHSDHLAGVPAAQARTPAGAHLPERCRDYLGGERPRVFGRDATVRFLPMWGQQPFSPGALREFVASGKVGFGGPGGDFTVPFDPAGFLADGDPVPGAPGWEVVASPGHTDCSISLYHRESASLASGDAVLTHDGRAWFNPEWVDLDRAAATEERLRSLEVEHLLPGHGLPISGDVWRHARPWDDCPEGRGLLTRCARRFGHWD